MPFRSFLLVSASGAGHVGRTVALLNLQHPHGVEGVGDHLQRLGVVQREKPQKRAGIHPDGVVFIGNIYGLIRLNGQPCSSASSEMESNFNSSTINHTSFMGCLKYSMGMGIKQ